MGLIGIISFLSSMAFVSPALNLLLLPIAFYRIFILRKVRVYSVLRINQQVGLVLMIVALGLSGVVYLIMPVAISNFDRSIVGGVPYIWLIFASLFIGLAFDRNDLRAIAVLVFIEIGVGALEYYLGVHSFLSVKFLGETQIGDTDLLYYNRVFGLSSNSSVYAFKVLAAFAIILAFREKLGKRTLILCGAILVAGFITSFNRTAIIAACIGLALVYSRSLKSILAIAIVGVAAALSLNLERMFTRGQGHVDLSGRDIVFGEFYKFIDGHLFIGNACEKVWIFIDGALYHAHNSYLELVASNGIVIAPIFFLGFYLFAIRGRFREASVFLVFSVYQYGLLWGLTFNDIVFAGLMSVLLAEKIKDRNARDGLEASHPERGIGLGEETC